MLLGTFIPKHSLQNVNPNVPKTCNLKEVMGKSMIKALRVVQGANGTHGRKEEKISKRQEKRP